MNSDLSLNDRLAVLDGVVCLHQWIQVGMYGSSTMPEGFFYRCAKCHDRCLAKSTPAAVTPHDHTYLSLDALRALAGRLGLFWSLGNIHHRDRFQSDVRGPTGPQGCIDPDPVTALGEAICAVMEVKANA